MERKEVTEQELVEIINREIEKHEECKNCQVSGILALRGTDENGCNWSEPYISCSGTPAEICAPIAARVIANIRQSFNLKI